MLVAIGITAMILFAIIALGKRHRYVKPSSSGHAQSASKHARWRSLGRIHSRGLLGLAAVANVILSMVAGFGICMALGLPFVALVNLLPFLLLGIGVDDAFILVNGIEAVKRERAEEIMVQFRSY